MKLPKEIRKKYDASINNRRLARVPIRLNTEERIILEKKMKEEEWENAAGYIRSKVFPKNIKGEYEKILKSGDQKIVMPALSVLMEELTKQIGYLNYRFDYSLSQLEKNCDLTNNIDARKMVMLLREYQQSILKRTEKITFDCETILRFLKIKFENTKKENIRYAPESVINKARKDWSDTRSPEALEGVRRDFEEYHRRMREEEENENQ